MDGLNVANNARIIYLHMVYLSQRPTEQLSQKVADVLSALQQITRLSHDQYSSPVKALDNRRLLISLGLVEVLTEMFVLDINVFGIQLTSYEKCSKFRRSIGNALMNLVYQQREAKFRLCTNRQFLLKVADVIDHVHPLIQFYAGLIQNVSYNADPSISQHLAIIVPPLVRTAVNISLKERDGGKVFDLVALSSQLRQQLLKVLSALWNLAEDPTENKRVMCLDVPEFVPMLLRIMFCDQNELQLIQAATGILKHLSDYFLQFPDLFAKILRNGATSALMHQLNSSSSDLIIDSLSALYTLSRHPIIGKEILSNQSYIQQISYLTRNTNEGISRASRLVLNNVYSATAYFDFQPHRHAASLATWPINKNYLVNKGHHNVDSRFESNDDDCIFVEGPLLDPGVQDLPTSVMCTRNASSRSSINSADGKANNEWSSTSVRSSASQSPASATDLPDSPSQCSSHKVFQLKEMEAIFLFLLHILKALDENKHSGQCTNADISGTSDAHAGDNKNNNILLEDQSSEGILAEAIRDFMPKPKDSVYLNDGVTRSSTPILTPISCNSPCKIMSYENDGPKHKGRSQLLEDSIAAVMPSPKHSNSNQFSSRDTSCSGTSLNVKVRHNKIKKPELPIASHSNIPLLSIEADKQRSASRRHRVISSISDGGLQTRDPQSATSRHKNPSTSFRRI
uniref:HECT-type E3 ubiquitin transferase n=1 Tax=Meloidogyne hapla TaxID=6305 RepID=A0A1I8BCY0_MELHA